MTDIHIQKVEIVVSGKEDPSRVARLTLDAIQKLSAKSDVAEIAAKLAATEQIVRDLAQERDDAKLAYAAAAARNTALQRELALVRKTTNELHRRIQRTEGDSKRTSTKGLHDGCRRELERVREGRNTDLRAANERLEIQLDEVRDRMGYYKMELDRTQELLDVERRDRQACVYDALKAERCVVKITP